MSYIVNNKLDIQNGYTGEPTGFTSPANITVTANGDRTITLTGTVVAYWKGFIVPTLVSGYTSPTHGTDITKNYYLYYNGTTTAWYDAVWTFDMLQICVATYDPTNAVWYYLREVHGLMDYRTHQTFHIAQGTYVASGGGANLSSYTLNSTTAANRRPLFNQVTINDEDLPTSVAALLSASYTRISLGTGLAYAMDVSSADIVNLVGNVPRYNQISGGNGTQVAMTNDQYQKLFVLALPVTADAVSQARRFVIIQGQTVSTTLSTIQAITFRSIQKGTFSSLLAEYVPVVEIIIRYVGGGTSNWSLIEVNTLNENRGSTTVVGQVGLTSVATDAGFSGIGTPSSPLSNVKTGVVTAIGSLPTTVITGSIYYVSDLDACYRFNGTTWLKMFNGVYTSGAFATDKGTWNANTNSPAITSGVGTLGDFYTVGTAGTTTIDGISEWRVGDYIWWNNSATSWERVVNSEIVPPSTDWIQYTGTFSRDSTSQITITGVNKSAWAGQSIRVTSGATVTKHYVKTATFTTGTVLTVIGTALPATINKLEIEGGMKTVVLDYQLWYSSLETATNGSSTYQQALDVNSNAIDYNGAVGNITAVFVKTVGSLGTNSGGADVNIYLSAALCSANIELSSNATNDCGVTITYANSRITRGTIPRIYGNATGNSYAAYHIVSIIVTKD